MISNTYENNYLNDIIFKIEFSQILQLLGEENSAKDFQEKIYRSFPQVKILQQNTFKISSSGQYTYNKDHFTWVFYNDGKKVDLTASSLTLEYDGNIYEGFEEFKKDIQLLLESLKVYPLIDVNFIGLRYINQIPLEPKEDINKLINNNLLSVIKEFETDKVLQSLTKTDLKLNDYILIFQYGQFNPEYPSININKDFILDFDCFTNET